MLRSVEHLDCRRAELLLEPLVDGELSGALRSALERHLDGCPHCRDELELARSIQSGLGRLQLEPAPTRIREAVLEHAAHHEAPHSRPWHWLAAAAVLAALLLIPGLMSSPRHSSPPPTDTQLERALEQSRFAFALVASASRRAGAEIRDDSLANPLVSQAVGHMLRPLGEVSRQSTKPDAGKKPPADTTPARS